MQQVVNLLQIILGVLLVLVILLQSKGTGLGSTFGGELAMYRTKRGAEQLLFRVTIVLTVLFILASVTGLLI